MLALVFALTGGVNSARGQKVNWLARCHGNVACAELAPELHSRDAVLTASAIGELAKTDEVDGDKFCPGDAGRPPLDLDGVAGFIKATPHLWVTQGPERGDGVGARAWAKINVAVAAEALGLRYAHAPLQDNSIPLFGPTDKSFSASAINWQKFLNLGALWPSAKALRPRTQQQEWLPLANMDLVEGMSDLPKLLSRLKPGPDAGVVLEHGYEIIDSCLHEKLWAAYAKVSRLTNLEYDSSPFQRAPCAAYDDAHIHVAVHLRRGDFEEECAKYDAEISSRSPRPWVRSHAAPG